MGDVPKKEYGMRQRVMYGMVALAILVAAVPAFATGGAEAGDATDGPVTVTFWHNYNDEVETPYVADVLLPMFEQAHPNINLEVVAQGSDQYSNLLITAMGTGSGPDVARIDLTSLANYADLGGILPVDDLPGFDGLKDEMFPAPMASNLFQGRYYGMPLDTNCKAAVVNMDAMSALGFDAPPATMEEFIQASDANPDLKPTINVSSVGEWDFLPYFWLAGGVLTDPDYTTARGYFDGPQSVAAVERLVELFEGGTLAIKEVDGSADAWDGVQTAEYAMIFEGPWFFAWISDYAEKNIVPATIPSFGGESASIVGGENVVIFSSSEHPEEAFEFITFMVSEEVQVMMAVNTNQIPVRRSAAAHPDIAANQVMSVYLEQMGSAQTRIPSPNKQLIEDYIKDAFDAIFREGAPVEPTLREAAELIDAEM
jgi:multiple sugar transport system substrate-binding protein